MRKESHKGQRCRKDQTGGEEEEVEAGRKKSEKEFSNKCRATKKLKEVWYNTTGF